MMNDITITSTFAAYCLAARERLPNIRLTFKPRSRAERGIGVVLAPSSRKNHDKVVYKVETVVRIAHLYRLSQASYLYPSNKNFASPDIMI